VGEGGGAEQRMDIKEGRQTDFSAPVDVRGGRTRKKKMFVRPGGER